MSWPTEQRAEGFALGIFVGATMVVGFFMFDGWRISPECVVDSDLDFSDGLTVYVEPKVPTRFGIDSDEARRELAADPFDPTECAEAFCLDESLRWCVCVELSEGFK